MRKTIFALSLFTVACFFMTGCSPDQGEEQLSAQKETITEPVDSGELVYLQAVSGEASSFDQTPDWAPKPDPNAPIDGDMMTRWSSDYVESEPWIYFDLGRERVVSNILIRWEAAYATEYKIFVSSDEEQWHEVYHKVGGEGDVEEIFISPVECRYVKIRAYEKVNEDWGISMWEFEIYGPAEDNPDAEFTKDVYLAARTDMDKDRAKAEKLIEELSEPIVSLDEKPFQKGVVFTSWMAEEFLLPASDLTLCEIKEAGFDTVSIMVPAYQETLYSTEVFVNDQEGGDTPTVVALEHAINTAHRLGMRVHLKPHVDPRTDEPRINIVPSEEWFDSYEDFIITYAEVAERNNVEMYSVGTELEATTFHAWTHRWMQIIEKVRDIYSGKLTYSANWTEYKDVPFWEELDMIGIDAYFPLTTTQDPDLEELVEGWERIADDIEAWREQENLTHLYIKFSEIGYPSVSGAGRQPWVAISEVVDEKEQADCYEAMFKVLLERDWFKGYHIWQYFPQRRWSPQGFTVRDKMAEDVIRKYLRK